MGVLDAEVPAPRAARGSADFRLATPVGVRQFHFSSVCKVKVRLFGACTGDFHQSFEDRAAGFEVAAELCRGAANRVQAQDLEAHFHFGRVRDFTCVLFEQIEDGLRRAGGRRAIFTKSGIKSVAELSVSTRRSSASNPASANILSIPARSVTSVSGNRTAPQVLVQIPARGCPERTTSR